MAENFLMIEVVGTEQTTRVFPTLLSALDDLVEVTRSLPTSLRSRHRVRLVATVGEKPARPILDLAGGRVTVLDWNAPLSAHHLAELSTLAGESADLVGRSLVARA